MEERTVSFSGDVGYLELVVVQISLAFQGVDVQRYLDYSVYQYLDKHFDSFDNVMPRRGDIMLELTSPKGTKSTLLPYRLKDSWPGNYTKWPFMSVHFWGEDPSGDWTLTVRNNGSTGTLEVSDIQYIFYGTATTPEAVSRIPDQCDNVCARGCAAPGPEFCDSCRQYRIADTLECVDDCPDDFVGISDYCYDANEPEPVCIRKKLPEPPTNEPRDSTLEARSSHLLLAVVTVSLCLISWLL